MGHQSSSTLHYSPSHHPLSPAHGYHPRPKQVTSPFGGIYQNQPSKQETRILALWGHLLEGRKVSGKQGRFLQAPGPEAAKFTLQALREQKEARASRDPQEKFSPLFCAQSPKRLPALGIIAAPLTSWKLNPEGPPRNRGGREELTVPFWRLHPPAGTSQPKRPFPWKPVGLAVAQMAPIWL